MPDRPSGEPLLMIVRDQQGNWVALASDGCVLYRGSSPEEARAAIGRE